MKAKKFLRVALVIASLSLVGAPVASNAAPVRVGGAGIGRTSYESYSGGPCHVVTNQHQFVMTGLLRLSGKTYAGTFVIDGPGLTSACHSWSPVGLHGKDLLGKTIAGMCTVNEYSHFVATLFVVSRYTFSCQGAINGGANVPFEIVFRGSDVGCAVYSCLGALGVDALDGHVVGAYVVQ